MHKDYTLVAKIKPLTDYPSTTYLCIHNLSTNSNRVSIEHVYKTENYNSASTITLDLYYSKDAINWSAYTPGTKIDLDYNDDHVYFKGSINKFYASASSSSWRYMDLVSIVAEDKYAVSGKISSILDPDITKDDVQVPVGGFGGTFFQGIYNINDSFEVVKKDHLEDASHLLLNAIPSSELETTGAAPYYYEIKPETDRTYVNLFNGCTKLKKAPNLTDIVVLTPGCFRGMFAYCSNLYYAPAVATTNTLVIPPFCYADTFAYCTRLATLPELPMWAVADMPNDVNSYAVFMRMFMGCSNIKFSATQDSTYKYQYNIPPLTTNGITTPAQTTYAYSDMVSYTGGTYTGQLPLINDQVVLPPVLYTSNVIVPLVDNN